HTYAAHDPYGVKADPGFESIEDQLAVARADGLLRVASEEGGLAPAGALWFIERYLAFPTARRAIFRDLGEERAHRGWQDAIDWLDGPGKGTPEVAALGARLRTAYRGGLAHADGVFARTLAALEKAGVGRDAAVFVVG